MSGEVIPFQEVSSLPANLQEKFGDSADDLISSGAGFPSLSIRGSKWRIKVDGDEVPLTNAETGDPVPSLELVVVRAVEGLSKNYFPGKYVEGDDAAPICFSVEGITPDAGCEEPQAESCAACPHNVWGSAITEQGNKTKACSDSKIIAVTFTADLYNEALGGVMMLRVPAASLKDLTRFGKGMKAQGFLPQQISMRVGFDLESSYPKLTFKAVRPLEQDEVNIIGELYDSEQVESMCTAIAAPVKAHPEAAAAPRRTAKQPVVDTTFESDEAEVHGAEVADAAPVVAAPVVKKSPAQRAPKAAAAVKAKAPAKKKAPAKRKAKAAAPVVAAAAVEEEEVIDATDSVSPSVDEDLDSILGDLNG